MLVSKLKNTFPVPDKPHCAFSDEESWSGIEEKLGIRLPADYKLFIGIYGTGLVGDFISLHNPFSTYKPANLFKQMERILRAEHELQDILLPLYPQSGGLLPFAKTYNGDILFWQTQGEPDNWTLYIREVRSLHYEQYAMNMSSFFIELVGHPFKKNALLKQSHIMAEDIDIRKPFVSLWIFLEQHFGDLKAKLQRLSGEQSHAVSQEQLESFLMPYGLDLDTPELKEQLYRWHQEQFIELIETPEVYLRIVSSK
jgi:hypothetical protein